MQRNKTFFSRSNLEKCTLPYDFPIAASTKFWKHGAYAWIYVSFNISAASCNYGPSHDWFPVIITSNFANYPLVKKKTVKLAKKCAHHVANSFQLPATFFLPLPPQHGGRVPLFRDRVVKKPQLNRISIK